ncbi:MAG TPA: hypothetical protein VGS07_08765 [Thermoanaerobaculia bacterium]|jgi:hypothetical protein|nr:hypothetical protein [Thermoanaerobaculia bacterium]
MRWILARSIHPRIPPDLEQSCSPTKEALELVGLPLSLSEDTADLSDHATDLIAESTAPLEMSATPLFEQIQSLAEPHNVGDGIADEGSNHR